MTMPYQRIVSSPTFDVEVQEHCEQGIFRGWLCFVLENGERSAVYPRRGDCFSDAGLALQAGEDEVRRLLRQCRLNRRDY